MVTFLQRTFTSLVHAHAGRTQAKAASPCGLDALTRAAALGVMYASDIEYDEKNGDNNHIMLFDSISYISCAIM